MKIATMTKRATVETRPISAGVLDGAWSSSRLVEDHGARDQEVVPHADHGVDHHDRGEHRSEPAAALDRDGEDRQLPPEPTGRRHAGERHHERGHRHRQQRRDPRQAGEVLDLQAGPALG